jgi:hypothetical protein
MAAESDFLEIVTSPAIDILNVVVKIIRIPYNTEAAGVFEPVPPGQYLT